MNNFYLQITASRDMLARSEVEIPGAAGHNRLRTGYKNRWPRGHTNIDQDPSVIASKRASCIEPAGSPQSHLYRECHSGRLSTKKLCTCRDSKYYNFL